MGWYNGVGHAGEVCTTVPFAATTASGLAGTRYDDSAPCGFICNTDEICPRVTPPAPTPPPFFFLLVRLLREGSSKEARGVEIVLVKMRVVKLGMAFFFFF